MAKINKPSLILGTVIILLDYYLWNFLSKLPDPNNGLITLQNSDYRQFRLVGTIASIGIIFIFQGLKGNSPVDTYNKIASSVIKFFEKNPVSKPIATALFGLILFAILLWVVIGVSWLMIQILEVTNLNLGSILK